MKQLPFSLLILVFISCQQPQAQTLLAAPLTPEQKAKQESIIETYATNKAHHYNYTLQLKE